MLIGWRRVAEVGVVPAEGVRGFDPVEDRRGELCRVVQVAWSGNSGCMVYQNDSIVVLCTLEATRSLEPRGPA